MPSSWHRWQLTAPLAALSRPVRADVPSATATPGSETATATAVAATTAFEGPAADGIPVHLGGAAARQVDPTTCGSAVLVMLAATGDPDLATWLETGDLPDSAGLPPEVPLEHSGLDAAGRFAAAQERVKAATGRRAVGPLPWPAAFGTPPWTAAREARFPGVRYRVRPLDDAVDGAAAVLAAIRRATLRGIPVPLYTGGDLRSGLAAAVPRHVVLAVPLPEGARDVGDDALHLYEPGRGRVHRVRTADLLARTEPHPALGGWTHVVAALLPVPDGAADGRASGHTGKDD